MAYGNSEIKDQRFRDLYLTTCGEGVGERGSAAREADGKGRRVERRPGCEGLPPRAAGEERGTEKANGGPPGGCGGAVMPRDGRAPAPLGAFGSRAQTENPAGARDERRGTARRSRERGGPAPARNAAEVSGHSPGPVPILDNGHRISSIMMKNITKSEAEITHNARVLLHPETGEVLEACIASRPIFREDGWEARQKQEKGTGAGTSEPGRAASRAKRELFKVAICNPFDLFVTLTLSPEKADRYDAKAAVNRLGKWLDNRVQRRGLKYIMVPELHEDGAIHFHGLVNAKACRLVDSGHRDRKGRTIYNVADWPLGFTTAVKLNGEYGAVCRYVSKYITKQSERGTIAGRYWYHGGDLLYPKERLFDVASMPMIGKRVEIPQAGLCLEYLRPEQVGGIF